jgi:hypothetical protein
MIVSIRVDIIEEAHRADWASTNTSTKENENEDGKLCQPMELRTKNKSWAAFKYYLPKQQWAAPQPSF